MRAALTLTAALALCVAPVVAQEKTKAPKQPVALTVLEVCDLFARNESGAQGFAEDRGWEIYPADAETPFLETFDAYVTYPDIGEVEAYVLIESYPETSFGYCRVDLSAPGGNVGVSAIDTLAPWQGELVENRDGTFGTWEYSEGNVRHLLLAHQTDNEFVLQLTIIGGSPAVEAN